MRSGAQDQAIPAHVVIVEDDPDLRECVAADLREDGYLVVTAPDGEEALSILRANPVDLVILDLGLPDLDGIDVIRRVRGEERLATTPILVISGEATTPRRIAAVTAGADDFLAKPVTSIELRTRTQVLVRTGQLQRQLVLRLARAEELDRHKSDLMHMLYHDQSNTMTGLLGYLDVIASGEVNEQQRGALRAALAIARELRFMTLDLLDIDRLAEKRFPLREEAVDVGRLVMDAVEEARVTVAGTREIGTDVPARTPAVRGDSYVIRRILRNLLWNALEHGGSTGAIFVTVQAAAVGVVFIAVEDDGPGIPKALRDRVFEKYGAVGVLAQTQRRGRGLGLAFSRLAARAHGGELSVEDRSPPLRGARFVLRLPAEAAPPRDTPSSLEMLGLSAEE